MDLSIAACATYATVTPVVLIAAFLTSDSLDLYRRMPLILRVCTALVASVIVISIYAAVRGVAEGGLNGYWANFVESGFASAVGALLGTVITQVVIQPNEPAKRKRPKERRDAEPERVEQQESSDAGQQPDADPKASDE